MYSGVTVMPRPFHPRRANLVNPVRVAQRSGGYRPTKRAAQCGRWRRSSHGLYVPWWVDSTIVEQRIVEAAAVEPGYAAVTDWGALRWLGGRWFTGTRADGSLIPVTLAADTIRAQPGIAVSEERINASEITAVDRLWITRPLHATLFAMRYADSMWDAVIVADMAAFNDLVAIDELWSYALRHPGMTGIPQARDAILLADENSWSPMETVMRLIWELVAEQPRPLTNTPVFDLQGRHIGTPDLLDVESGTYGEYDSAYHLDGARRVADLRREHAFKSVGLEPVVMMAGEPGGRDAVAARIVATRDRALRQGRDRLWTIDQPDWWLPTQTVAQRRALSDVDRARLLAHRQI
jgi:hypothetical protein